MDIKVREVTAEDKSTQEIEKELLDKHEQSQGADVEQTPEVDTEKISVEPVEDDGSVEKTEEAGKEEIEVKEEKIEVKEEEEIKPETPAATPPQMEEKDVLSYIGKRYGKEIDSIDELISTREEAEKLPEDVASYLKYKKETGRGIGDYAKLQKDYSELTPDALLKEYYTITEEGLDPEDIDSMMDDFTFDEEVDEPADIKKVKLAKKKEIAKAKKFLKQQQELYKQPLESRESSATANEEIIEYRQYLEKAKTQEEQANQKREWFIKKSDELFTPEFKGFRFKVGEEDIVYSPGTTAEIKKDNATPLNLINKYLDSQGFIKDAEGYHKALALAMNPEKFATFFYEQGKSQATDDVMRKTKNINMSERTAPEVSVKSGFQVKSVSEPSSRGLRIKSIKKT